MKKQPDPDGSAKDDVCPHCGAVLDVYLALKEDGASVSKGRAHLRNLPFAPAPEEPADEG